MTLNLKHVSKAIAVFSVILTLAACGYQIQKPLSEKLTAEYLPVKITGDPILRNILVKKLKQQSIAVVNLGQEAKSTINIRTTNQQNRQYLIASDGRTAESLLVLKTQFTWLDQQNQLIGEKDFSVTETQLNTPGQILAQDTAIAQRREELRDQTIDQIIKFMRLNASSEKLSTK